ncbi:MAG TPA: TonB-dependent receptor, partial [Cytophagales bacterium]|nr:TonB-dependent receptor [Cytophagales bacterium]
GVAITNPAIQVPFVNEFGQQAPGGSQGFPGYSPANVVDEYRTNFGVYGDAELNLTDDFLVAGALRFERYSDFGSTFNYKVATRYALPMGLSLRASVSSGFRAPSLAQIHYNLVFNNIVAGTSVRTLLASNTSTVAKSFGIEPLKQEVAQNYAAGVTYQAGNFTATVDGYLIDVTDRIILTDYFDATALGVGVEAAQFFANGVDTRTTGLDIILNYNQPLANEASLSVGVAGNFNNTEILAIKSGDLNEFTFFGPFSQAYLEAAAPDYKLNGMVSFTTKKFSASLTWTQYSAVLLQDFQWVDAPATNQAEADALFAVATDTYEVAGTLDLSVSYELFKNTRLTLGANNILNTYPTPQFDAWTDQGGFNDSVQMGSDGAYFFGRIGFAF